MAIKFANLNLKNNCEIIKLLLFSQKGLIELQIIYKNGGTILWRIQMMISAK